jgi:hypothetical protein
MAEEQGCSVMLLAQERPLWLRVLESALLLRAEELRQG